MTNSVEYTKVTDMTRSIWLFWIGMYLSKVTYRTKHIYNVILNSPSGSTLCSNEKDIKILSKLDKVRELGM